MASRSHHHHTVFIAADFISSISELYGLIGVVLFVTLGFTISIQFDHLRQRIETTWHQNQQKRQQNLEFLPIAQWKRDHLNLIRRISYLQQCFGAFLLVFISHVFVEVISRTFHLTNAINHLKRPTLMYAFMIFNIVWNVVNLFVLAAVPVVIENEVLSV